MGKNPSFIPELALLKTWVQTQNLWRNIKNKFLLKNIHFILDKVDIFIYSVPVILFHTQLMNPPINNESSLTVIIDHILTRYHEPLKSELPIMIEKIEKLVRVHGANHPELQDIELILKEFSTHMMEHLRKEETILFPMMRTVQKTFDDAGTLGAFHCWSIGNPIRQMEVEHGGFEQNLQKLRLLTHEYILPTDACKTYTSFYEQLLWLESDTLEHASLENTILHRLAKEREGVCKTKLT
jgi:iron-sulfur cluster repair di-iron protein